MSNLAQNSKIHGLKYGNLFGNMQQKTKQAESS